MILTNCRLVPELCEGFQEEMADIRIEGNTIAEILPSGGHYVGEEVLDCKGKTVLPGLFNMHVHLFFNTLDSNVLNKGQTEYQHIINHTRYMRELLSYGYTSLRDVGGPYNISIKLKNDINAGKMVGPDIKACGIILTPDHIAPQLECYSAKFSNPISGPYEARAAARRQIVEGADFIKILGCSAAPTCRGGGALFYPDELAELAEVVKREGTYLAIHTNCGQSSDIALEYDPQTIEHGNNWTKENTDKLIARGMKSTIVPTLQILKAFGVLENGKGLRMAYDAGALIGWGSDAWEEIFLAEPQCEFVLRSELWDIPTVEILKQATINSAKINGTDNLRGSIKVGKRADFAIIEGKPDEDLMLFGTPCAYVLKDGVIVAQNGMVKAIS